MDKKRLTQEMIDSGKSFEELGFTKISFLPYSECVACAREMVTMKAVPDPDGVMYTVFDDLAVEAYLYFKYFTDVDTDDWNTEKGRYALTDFYRKNDLREYSRDWSCIEDIYLNMYDAMEKKHNHTSSLSYKIGKAFESILGNEDIVRRIAESREINEQMIDILGVYRKAKEKETTADGLSMKMFARK